MKLIESIAFGEKDFEDAKAKGTKFILFKKTYYKTFKLELFLFVKCVK